MDSSSCLGGKTVADSRLVCQWSKLRLAWKWIVPLEDGPGESGMWIGPVGHVGRIDAKNQIDRILHCSVDPGVCWSFVLRGRTTILVVPLRTGLWL